MRWLPIAIGIIGGAASGWALTPAKPPAGAPDVGVLLGRALAEARANRHEAVLSILGRIPESAHGENRVAILALRSASLDKLHLWAASEADLRELVSLSPEGSGHLDRLLDQWFFQERRAEGAELAVEAHPAIKSPSAAALLLLEIVRQESEQPGPAAVAAQLEPVRARDPTNGPAAAALGRVYVLSGRAREGLDLLDEAVRLAPTSRFVWERWLTAVADTGRFDRLADPPRPMPAEIAAGGLAKSVAAQAADAKGDVAGGDRLMAEAVAAAPGDRKLRFAHAQRLARAGRTAEADAARAEAKRLDAAREALGALFQRVDPRRRGDALVTAAIAKEFAAAYAALGQNGLAACWTREAGRRR